MDNMMSQLKSIQHTVDDFVTISDPEDEKKF